MELFTPLCLQPILTVMLIVLIFVQLKRRRDYAIKLEERVTKLERSVAVLNERTRRQQSP